MKACAMTDRPYYSEIDALKGIAIFLVVLGHSIILFPIDLHQNNICLFIFNWLSSVHMQLFFVVSGFCFGYRCDYKTYIQKKIKRLMIPYFVFNLLDMAPRYLFPGLVNRPRGVGESIIKIIFNGGELWFLYTLFIIFLIYPFIYKLVKNSVYKYAGLLLLLFAAQIFLPDCSVFTISRVIYYMFYFTIGVLIKSIWNEKIFDVKWNLVRDLPLVTVLLTAWIFLVKENPPCINTITPMIGIITLYILTRSRTVTNMFKPFGKYSLQLYLLNGFSLVISRTFIISIAGICNPFIIISFNMLVDFFVSYIIIKYICEKIKWIRLLMGMQLES